MREWISEWELELQLRLGVDREWACSGLDTLLVLHSDSNSVSKMKLNN